VTVISDRPGNYAWLLFVRGGLSLYVPRLKKKLSRAQRASLRKGQAAIARINEERKRKKEQVMKDREGMQGNNP